MFGRISKTFGGAVLAGATCLALVTGAWAAPVPAGPELDIAPISGGNKSDPSACTDGSGTFVVAWHEDGGPTLRRYDSEGNALGAPVVASSSADGFDPALACRANGEFIAVWSTPNPIALGANDIFARLFDASGSPSGLEFQINSGPLFDAAPRPPEPAVSFAPDGSFVVAWILGVNDGVVARHFDDTATPTGLEFTVDPGPHGAPDIDHDSTGNFTIVSGETGQRYDSAGLPDGGPLTVPGENFSATTVCYDSVGGSLVVGRHLMGQRYLGSGSEVGGLFPLTTDLYEADVALACTSDGGLTAAWSAIALTDGHLSTLRARRLDAASVPVGSELRPPTTRVGRQSGFSGGPAHALAGDDSGRVLAVWVDSRGPLEAGSRVTARMFCDDGDAGCRYACPGFDPLVDPDGDGIPSGCDACTNVGGAQDVVGRTSLRVVDNKDFGSPSLNKFGFKTSFDLPLGSDFSTLAPDADGARLLVDSEAVGTIVDAVLPNGAFTGAGTRGWRRNGPGTKWQFQDKTATRVAGVHKVTLKDDSARTPGRVRVTVKARSQSTAAAVYPLLADDLPPRSVIVLGGQTMSDAGVCGEARFVAEDCSFKDGPPAKLRCKRR